MADRELYRDKIEVSLDGRQVFYLFFGGAAVVSLVFVLGVLVGKRANAMTLGKPAVAADSLASLDARADVDLTFSSALLGDKKAAMAPVDIALADRAMPAQAAPEPAPAHAAAKEAKEAKAAPAAKTKANASAKAEPKATAKAKATAQAEPEAAAKDPDDAAKDDPKHTAAPAPSQDAIAGRAGSTAKPDTAKFTLQLASFDDRGGADSLFAKLKAAGYQPYLDRAEIDGSVFFRVRLGYYASWDDAVAAKSRFESSQHVIAYVTPL